MTDNYKTLIETVVVEVNGQTVDCVTTTSRNQAEAYKRGVRSWATERGVCARVYSQTMEVSRKEHAEPALVRPLAFAQAV